MTFGFKLSLAQAAQLSAMLAESVPRLTNGPVLLLDGPSGDFIVKAGWDAFTIYRDGTMRKGQNVTVIPAPVVEERVA